MGVVCDDGYEYCRWRRPRPCCLPTDSPTEASMLRSSALPYAERERVSRGIELLLPWYCKIGAVLAQRTFTAYTTFTPYSYSTAAATDT